MDFFIGAEDEFKSAADFRLKVLPLVNLSPLLKDLKWRELVSYEF